LSARSRLALPLAAIALFLLLALALALRNGPGEVRVQLVDRPVSVHRALTPQDPQFGDTVMATIDVFVDPHRVDPQSVRVAAGFAPYGVASSRRTVRSVRGVWVTHLEDRLRCLDVACAPAGNRKSFRFAPLRVSYREASRRATLVAAWPAVRVHSRVATADLRHPVLRVPRPRPGASDYRLPPRATGFALLAVAALLALGGGALLLRATPRRAQPARRGTKPLERILSELAAVSSNGDTGRRRRALEELARELEPLDEPLSIESRVLAWAPRDPQPEAISELTRRVRTEVSP
jgi:hypothetical protein